MRRELLLVLLLAGCATVAPPQPNLPISVPIAQPMALNPVQWQVMTAEQLQQLATQLQKAQNDHVVFVLDAQNYNNLSLNLIEIERYIKEQKTILELLQSVIAERAKSKEQ